MRESGLIMLAVAGLAAPSFCLPLRGDEASYLATAEALTRGQVLYRDAWDITNPGVFAWYALAGTLFGFTEDGVRLLDLGWQLVFAVTLSAAVRRAYALPRLPVLPGVVVAGLYFLAGYSNSNHLARTEGLVVFPLFVAVYGASVGGRRWLLAAGAAAGVVVLFKLMLAGLVAAGWLTLWIVARRASEGFKLPRSRVGLRSGVGTVFWLAAGIAIPVGAAVGYFASRDALSVAGWTLFTVPRLMLSEVEPAGISRLATAVQWFAGHFAGLGAVATVGAACRRPGRDPFLTAWLVVLAACVPVLLSQRLSWWAYHWMLPGGVVAVLVGYTLPAIRSAVAGLRLPAGAGWVGAGAAAAGLAPLLLAGGFVWLHAAGHRLGLTTADRTAARLDLGNAYRRAAAEADWLAEPGRKPGDILVGGDPLIHRFSGRRSAVRALGWSLEMWPKAVRDGLVADVRERRPVYVFLSRGTDDFPRLVRESYPELADILARDYRPARDTGYGIWYERID